ncbi:unnamed protein product [Penicillium roqueforti FM164]|uniref:Genomic scaffold, ProqFM164S02 n=1 Tax=Penicillium roqueforti (strain FM164) TaxID=1365484 RepID=W6Q877_PENRF|nr:unnamed protein product [Penicillium roqueforti FM164]
MTSPEPYGSSRKTLDNSPLAADGSDFPYKISPGNFIVPTEEATYRTGSNNSIKLLGSATHGGGSCQAVVFSLTYMYLRMTSPESYGSSRKTLNNSLLAIDGSDFPYKISLGDFIVLTEEATYRTRSNNSIKLLGSATYGSRSCQDPEILMGGSVNGCITRENVDIHFPWPGSIVEYNGDSKYRPQEGEPVCTGNPTFGPIPITDTADTGEANSTTENANSMPCSRERSDPSSSIQIVCEVENSSLIIFTSLC